MPAFLFRYAITKPTARTVSPKYLSMVMLAKDLETIQSTIQVWTEDGFPETIVPAGWEYAAGKGYCVEELV